MGGMRESAFWMISWPSNAWAHSCWRAAACVRSEGKDWKYVVRSDSVSRTWSQVGRWVDLLSSGIARKRQGGLGWRQGKDRQKVKERNAESGKQAGWPD